MRNPTLSDSPHVIQLEEQLGADKVSVIEDQHLWLNDTFVNPKLVISTTSTVLKPNGEVLFHLIKGHVDEAMLANVKPHLRKVTTTPIIGGFRGSSSGGTEPSYRSDGTLSNEVRVPYHDNLVGAKDGILGKYDRTGRENYCRLTAFNQQHFVEYFQILPYLQRLDSIYKDYAPEKYAAQAKYLEGTASDWLIEGTIASTATVNYNYPTTAHRDSGDCRAGMGVIAVCRSGSYYGGALCFPEFRCAVKLADGDVLLADVHALHGNLPILGSPGGYERLSTILYAREKIVECGTLSEEQRRYEEQQAWKAKRKSTRE